MSDVASNISESREVNVLLELLAKAPMSVEVLDANSDDVLEVVQQHARDIALGPTISLRTADAAILLRFDLRARSESEAYRQLAAVMELIEGHTDLTFERSRSAIELTAPAHGKSIAC
jgi:hypothetical protein